MIHQHLHSFKLGLRQQKTAIIANERTCIEQRSPNGPKQEHNAQTQWVS